MPILVLDGYCNAAVETLQSLGSKGLEVDVSVESADCLAFHSRYVARKLRQPAAGSEDFIVWLREQFALRQYDLIVPATEASLLGIRTLEPADRIRLRSVVPGNRSIDIALDKHKTYEFARGLGVPMPQCVLLSGKAESNLPQRFPVVLKSLHSKVVIDGNLRSFPAQVVRNVKEYQEVLNRWQPFTAMEWQEYIYGRGIGAEFLYNHGKKVWHFVHERLHELPLTGGASSYRRSIEPPPALLSDSEKLLTALEWHGVAMVEFRVDVSGQHWLMEINPRLWGSLALAIDAGVDFPLGLWNLASGTEPSPQPCYRAGFYTRDLKMDFHWFIDNLRANPDDKLLLTKSSLLAALQLLRPLIGREAWDHFDLHDFSLLKGILGSVFTAGAHRFGDHLKRKPDQHTEDQPVPASSSPEEVSSKPGAHHLH
ncbi:MAG TPA: ATP-grasp domain-containing protein [Candidatus Acidoferrales bacterium]|nr:ATP-grasp domain-containing protein [Candidatus Acidoferrales bacterium]